MDNVIKSQDNLRYRGWQRLLKKKYRDREGRCLIEGDNLIEEADRNGVKIHGIILKENAPVRDRTRAVTDKGVPVTVLSEKLFTTLSQTEASQGAIAEIEIPRFAEGDIERGRGGGGDIVVLDRLQDPGNLGTIIRTADAAGFDGIICLKGTAEVWAPKVMRSAAGSVFRVPTVYVGGPKELFELIGRTGKKLAVTAFDEAVSLWEAPVERDTAIVIGNEAGGVSEELMRAADLKIKIPMYGEIESLNAAVAAGIIMYESVRKNTGEDRENAGKTE